jgi:tyrosinase
MNREKQHMGSITRRAFVKGAVALPIAMGAIPKAFGATRMRYDLASPQGQQMLAIYADAVRQMQALGPDNPMSWTWQWYTHFVDGATTKADEITRIFGTTVTPRSTLANETWNTCQSHSGQNSNYFLPWHRLYINYIERIVRQVCGNPDFTLPYWNYTSSDPAQRGVVPEQFRMPDDPVFGSLYRPERGTLANSGQPIQKYQPGDVMDITTALSCANYSTVDSVQGFCRSIDSGIHGRIHVLTGTSKGMGEVPYAGRDPLFFVHHANIDRMWASWNKNGGKNPPATEPWTTKSFVFADANGVRVSRKLNTAFSALSMGYDYDAFFPKPPKTTTTTTTTTAALMAKGGASTRVAQATSGADLGASTVHVSLLPVAGTRRTEVLGLDPGAAGKRVYLVVKDLHCWTQPEVLYHLYLTTPSGRVGLSRDTYVGNINFFDAEFHDHGHGAMAEALGENFYSFDVTDLLRRIGRSGDHSAAGGLKLSFVPGGTPNPKAKPLVATIELVRQ